MIFVRDRREINLIVEGQSFVVEVLEIPFREGVELLTKVNGQEVRISDRQLGEEEALRLIEEEIKRLLTN